MTTRPRLLRAIAYGLCVALPLLAIQGDIPIGLRLAIIFAFATLLAVGGYHGIALDGPGNPSKCPSKKIADMYDFLASG